MLVVSAEHAGATSRQALGALGLEPPESGALAVVLSSNGSGPTVTSELLGRVAKKQLQDRGLSALRALCEAAGLPSSVGFGTVRPPE
jgi:hypothetical protein